MEILNQKIIIPFEQLFDTFIVTFLGQYELMNSDRLSKYDHFNFKLLNTEKSIMLPGNNHEIDTKYSIKIYCIFSIAAYEILISWTDYQLIADKTEILFLKHIRNASLNDNRFILNKEVLPSILVWRRKKLTTRRNGKECFFAFLSIGDLFVLFDDIVNILKQSS